jgi:hypothetical protein
MTDLVRKLLKPKAAPRLTDIRHHIKGQGQNNFTLLWQSGEVGTSVRKLKLTRLQAA